MTIYRVHWIPIECYTNLEFAKRSTAADVWAFSTTLWEIFMFGEEIKTTDHVDAMRVSFLCYFLWQINVMVYKFNCTGFTHKSPSFVKSIYRLIK